MSDSIFRRQTPPFLVMLIPTAVLLAFAESPVSAVPQDGAAAKSSLPAKDASSLPNWTAQIVSNKVQNATALCLDDQGNLYVAETFRWGHGVADNRDHTYWIMDDLACDTVADRAAVYKKWKDKFEDEDFFTRYSDRVVRLEDPNRDGHADVKKIFATGFNRDVDGPAIGLLYGHDSIYLTCVPDVWRLTDLTGDGIADQRESLQTGFGVKTSLSGHDLHGLTWGPDGKLYFSMGDRGFHCVTRENLVLKDVNSGAVFRCNPDGSEMEIFYHQLRNPQEIAFNEYGDLFTVDNNCDQGDSARVCYLLEGGNSGWHLGAQAQTTYSDSIDDGDLEQPPHWLAEGLWKLRHPQQPAHILPPIAHLTNGPAGMTFHSGIGFSGRYQNHFLVCDYKGAPNLCFLYSFRVQPSEASYTMSDAHIVRGGIPVTDVEVGHDGRLLVTDFGGGWRRTDKGNVLALFDRKHRTEPDVGKLQQIFQQGFKHRSVDELIALLGHRDMRVRLRAQSALAATDDDVSSALAVIAQSPSPAGYHAMWALGQRRETEKVNEILKHDDSELRAQACRTLGNIGDRQHTDFAQLRARLSDANARVRTFAAISLGKLADRDSIPLILRMVEENANRDAFERHSAVFALSRLYNAQELSQLSVAKSPSVRLVALLALRHQRASEVAEFLNDTEPFLVDEAIRAINEYDIDDCRAIADFAAQLTSARQSILSKPRAMSEMIFRRLINGCLRSGRENDALTLVELASTPTVPLAYRLLAMKTVSLFDAPPPIDPTLGTYRPLPPRDSGTIRNVIEPSLRQLFAASSGDLAASTIEAMSHYGIRLEDEQLVRRVRDGRQPEAVRRVGLEQLFEDKRYDQIVLLKSLLVDESPMIRAAAADGYVRAFPDDAETAIRSLLDRESDTDFRTAFDLLSKSDDPRLIGLLCEQLDRFRSGDLFRTVQLDLYEAAAASPNARVARKLAEIDSMLAAEGRSIQDLTREGGDPQRGERVFQNQGLCMKCHRGGRGGGDAGPPLTNIGRLRRSDELLESVVEPNAVVVAGYGTVTLVLSDGRTVNGTPIQKTKTDILIKTNTGESLQIAREEIDEISDVTSPMPKPAQNLTRQELRDLLAYLESLRGA